MKIGFFVINNVIGGGGMVATENAINTIKNKHDIVIFLEDIIADNSKHLLNIDGVKYIKVGKLSEYNSICTFFDKLKKESIDIFITHCHYYFDIIKLFNGIKSLGIKVILNEHHYHFIPVYEKRLPLYLNRDRYLQSCDLITTIEKTSYFIWKSEGYNVAYLPNTYIKHNKHSTLTKKKQVIIAGRFTDFKQIELGILAFSIAYERHKEWKLIILGKGPEQKNILNTVKTSCLGANVTIIPWTSEPERYFAESAIHLLPSYTEPFGLVIADAKMSKIPTVMFDLKSNNLIRNGIDGYKVSCGDIKAMAGALEKLMASQSLRESMGAVAYQTLLQNQPEYTEKVWNEIFNYVMRKDILDEKIYKDHFDITLSHEDLDALIFDYNSLITWKCKKELKQPVASKQKSKKQNIGTAIRNFAKKKIDKLGKIIFNITQRICKCNYIILWDSNGVAFMSDCLANKFSLPTKVIIPKNNFFTPILAYYLARAKVFITNTNTPYVKMLLSKKTNIPYIINVWHACGYFKKFGVHENNIGIQEHRKRFGKPTYVLCSSEKIKHKYSEIFGIDVHNIKPFGVPRTDLLFNSQTIADRTEKFYTTHPELKNKKLYVLAPTWRGEPFKSSTAFYSPKLDFEKVAELLKDDEVLIIKNHQLVTKNLKKQHKDNIKCVSKKVLLLNNVDIMTLTIVCDVFITDFSSAYFEALILNKPILFYAEDINTYSTVIGFYDKYKNYAPGDICDKPNPQEFIKKIRNAHSYIKSEKYKKIREKFVGNCDGHASKRLINFVNNLDLVDYATLWKKYVKRIHNVSDKLIFPQDLSKHFYTVYIKDIDRKIHFELLYRQKKRYLCLHFEDQKYCTNEFINFIQSFDEKHYNIQIGTHKLGVECMVNINTVKKEFESMLSVFLKMIKTAKI